MRYAPCRALTGGFPLCSWLCWAALALHRVPGVAGCCPLPLPGDSQAQEALKHHQEHFFFFFFLRALLGSGNSLGVLSPAPPPFPLQEGAAHTPAFTQQCRDCSAAPRSPSAGSDLQLCEEPEAGGFALPPAGDKARPGGDRAGGRSQERCDWGGGSRTTLGLKDLASALFSATGRGETQLPSRLLVARGCPAPR